MPDPSAPRPLRLWPGQAIVAVTLALRLIAPRISPDLAAVGILAGLAGAVLILGWWLLASRAPWKERLAVTALSIAALIVGHVPQHVSIGTGAMGLLYFLLAMPAWSLALVAWATLRRRLKPVGRGALLVGLMLVACGGWALLRTEGLDGRGNFDLVWRWSSTAEERLLATETPAVAGTVAPLLPAEPEWPGFRGPRRDGIVRHASIGTDLPAAQELWRRPVGPGWSSFAVWGGRLYTQEQRGESEVVACYDRHTGAPLWTHEDPERFWESNAGAGPRATPTLHDGTLYTQGATGVVNALDAATGAVRWSWNAGEALRDLRVPYWGLSGSPLVVDGQVLLELNGIAVGLDATTGTERFRWPVDCSSACSGESYGSPQRVTLDGIDQTLFLRSDGLFSFDLARSAVPIWDHAWPGAPIVQPRVVGDRDLLFGVTAGSGLRRLSVAQTDSAWVVEERWTSKGLKPYFNDFVVHEGHAYGFDGSILACIDVETGERRWKGGRYGNGQLLLVEDAGLLLVLSEGGEVVLVRASPEGFEELSRVSVLDGKTWNHPVLVDGTLYVRNDREMVALELPVINEGHGQGA